MFSSQILEVAIGLIFFFLFLSLGFTALNELLASKLGRRAAKLKEGIEQLLQSPDHIKQFYDHPLIKGLCNKEGRTPSYIPSRTFALTILSIAGGTIENIDKLLEKLRESSDDKVKRQLLPILESAQGKMDVAIKNVEYWFDTSMERVTGWYKRWTMKVTVIVASVVCIVLNADSIMITKMLWTNASLRSDIANTAEKYLKDATSSSIPTSKANDSLAQVAFNSLQKLVEARFPLGWPKWKSDSTTSIVSDIAYVLQAVPYLDDKSEGKKEYNALTFLAALLYKCMGIAFTVLAITIGAPFWFDALGSFVKLRSSIAPKPKKE